MGSYLFVNQTLSFVTAKSSLSMTLERLGLPECVTSLASIGPCQTDGTVDPLYYIGDLSASFQTSEHAQVLPASVHVRLEVTDRCPQQAVVALNYGFQNVDDNNPARKVSLRVDRALVREGTVGHNGSHNLHRVWQDGSILAWAEQFTPDTSFVPSPFERADELFVTLMRRLRDPMPIELGQPRVEPPDAPF